MLTIFACPKPFIGSTAIMQRNAIKSWTLLKLLPEIILIGDEEGTVEVCREFGLRHIPEVECNEYGVPLVNAVFHIGQSLASNPYACYVNADIILLNCFAEAAQRVIKLKGEDSFLAVGRRWNLNLKGPLDFKNTQWESKLRTHLKSHGKLASPWAVDYFFFPVGLWENIPPFTLGRCHWDNWLVYDVYSRNIQTIDVTPVTVVIHQNHDYSHISGGEEGLRKGVEMKHNWELQGGYYSRIYNIWDSTHILSKSLKKAGRLRHLVARWIRFRYFLIILLVKDLHPFSRPLVVFLRGIKSYVRSMQKLLKPTRTKPL